jgi:hypothetical protein
MTDEFDGKQHIAVPDPFLSLWNYGMIRKTMRHTALALVLMGLALGGASAADPPQTEIRNRQIKVKANVYHSEAL